MFPQHTFHARALPIVVKYALTKFWGCSVPRPQQTGTMLPNLDLALGWDGWRKASIKYTLCQHVCVQARLTVNHPFTGKDCASQLTGTDCASFGLRTFCPLPVSLAHDSRMSCCSRLYIEGYRASLWTLRATAPNIRMGKCSSVECGTLALAKDVENSQPNATQRASSDTCNTMLCV